MKPKIIFYDIDGTLLSESTGTIPDSAIQAITKAKESGHLSIINTGRAKATLEPFITESVFDGYICGCGTYVEFNNKILYHQSLGNDLSKKIVTDLWKFRLAGVLEGISTIYYDYTNKTIHPRETVVRKRHMLNGFHCLSWEEDSIDFDKFTLWITKDSNFNGFYNKYKTILDFIDRGNHLYEIAPKGHSKAGGMEYLIHYLDIPHENTYAIGDSTNDLLMLKYAANSIAMENSAKELYEIVTYVTTSVENNGIANALKHFHLI